MAKQSPKKSPPIAIQEKPGSSISDEIFDSENTMFPGSDYLKKPIKGYSHPDQGTSGRNWEENVSDLSAPVYLPKRTSLSVDLVPSDLVFRLEEYRKDGSFFTAFFWTLIGTILSILYDLVTTVPFLLSVNSISLLILLGIFTIIFGILSLVYSIRANQKFKEIKSAVRS